MKAYASRTGTRRNLAALRTAGWGLFVSAAGADSFDGSGPSRYEKHLHEMQAAREIAVQLGLRMTSDAELLEEMR